MFDLILFVTVLIFWLGSIWLYFFFDRLLEDVRAISEDLNDIRAELKLIEKQAKEVQDKIPGEEFLGI
tara:strand:+ start:154 stop:357 length:204 start_codon:yes stop_codon:yes gene_type:complete